MGDCFCHRCRVDIVVKCPECGERPAKRCKRCDGTGTVSRSNFRGLPDIPEAEICGLCHGTGWRPVHNDGESSDE